MNAVDRARALLPALRGAVREAGALALARFRPGASADARVWMKDDRSPVTEADLAVDALLGERLRALAPEAGWLSEETADDPARLDRPLVWIVDPIDGTRAFAGGMPEWCVSVALVADGRPVAACVHAPVEDLLYEAILGQGATRNGAPVRVSEKLDLDGARASGPKALVDRIERDLLRRTAGAAPLVRLPKIPSLALRLLRVAEGSIDLGLAGGRAHDWDIAGADLVLHEAGGRLGDATGTVPVYNRPEPVHRELLAASARLHALACGALPA